MSLQVVVFLQVRPVCFRCFLAIIPCLSFVVQHMHCWSDGKRCELCRHCPRVQAGRPEWWQYPKAEAGTLMQPKTIRKRLEYYFHCYKHMLCPEPELDVSGRDEPLFKMWHRRPNYRSGKPLYWSVYSISDKLPVFRSFICLVVVFLVIIFIFVIMLWFTFRFSFSCLLTIYYYVFACLFFIYSVVFYSSLSCFLLCVWFVWSGVMWR